MSILKNSLETPVKTDSVWACVRDYKPRAISGYLSTVWIAWRDSIILNVGLDSSLLEKIKYH